MPIQIQNNIFHLETEHSLYQMKVDKFGVLQHLWYGAKVDVDMSYLLEYPDVGFSGNIYDAGDERTYSLNSIPQEYPTVGTGDYRVPALSIVHSDGSNALDLRYKGYEIVKGKYGIPGLPAVYTCDDEAETLYITLKDKASEVYVRLAYGVLPERDVITRSVIILNKGVNPVKLNRAHSACLDIPYGNWDWIHFEGRHAAERQPERCSLFHGIQESSSGRGNSSHQQNPTVILCDRDCTETSGVCVGAALVYSGGFQIQIEMDQLSQVRLVMGIQPDTFSWELKSGETFYTPEVIFSCSTEGLGTLSRQFHAVIRNNVCRGAYQFAERPVLINNWEATYFDFDEDKILHIAKQAAELGVEMLVLDDGWFGKRDSDTTGLGDWFVNENKLKGGLSRLVSKVNALGMKFGIWFEPEMISEDSDLFRAHPEWVIRIPNREPVRSRFQLVLDMSRDDVRDYLYDRISSVLNSANITYVKWDMNRSVCDWYSKMLPAERQGELPHRYILGVYALLERLNSEFPHVLIEGCSGGGGRFDAGILQYCPQIWCSDDTDAYERTRIQYGTSFFYPISTVGSHISAVPNHQTGRVSDIDTRCVVAMAGSFGYELDLNTLSDTEKVKVAEQITRFKKYNTLIHNGLYYRLSDPTKENFAAWSFVSVQGDKVLVQGMTYRAKPNVLQVLLKLRGLILDAKYRMVTPKQSEDVIYTGVSLMYGGILLPKVWGDDRAFEYYFERVDG